MSISIEDLRRLIFHEKRTYDEIARMYKISPNKVKQMAKYFYESISAKK